MLFGAVPSRLFRLDVLTCFAFAKNRSDDSYLVQNGHKPFGTAILASPGLTCESSKYTVKMRVPPGVLLIRHAEIYSFTNTYFDGKDVSVGRLQDFAMA